MELDGNMGLHTHKDFHFSLYHYTKLVQTADKRSMDKKVHLRVHHPNVIVSLGFQNWNCLGECRVPNVLSGWILGGVQRDGVSVFGGVNSGFNVHDRRVNHGSALLGVKHKQFTGFLDYSAVRNPLAKTVAPEVTAPTATVTTPPTTATVPEYTHVVKALFDSRVNSDVLVFGEATTNLTALTSVVVGGEYNLGDNTKVKVKVFHFLI